jgi:hypothetical protein
MVENVAATPLDKIAPTSDLLLSSDNLQSYPVVNRSNSTATSLTIVFC